jgi:hypothetical protein
MEKALPNISLKDESFIKENARHYSLSVEISYDGLAYTVFDEVKNRYILLESYSFNKVFNDSQLIINLQKVADSCENLKYDFEKSLIMFKNNKYTFIPSALFIPEERELYLRFNQDVENSDLISSDLIKNISSQNIYATPRLLSSFISGNFTNYSLQHHITALIEIILFKFKNNDENKSVFVNLSQSFVDILILENQKLLLCNTFQFKTGEDFIYYLMFVFEQMKLNPEKTGVTIMGEIEKDSALFNYIEKYIRNTCFIERNNDFSYSYQMDKLPQHYFYNLFNLKLCGL